MEPLPRIPTPLRQRWREFRVAYLPPLTFLLLVGCIAWMWARYVHPLNLVGEVEAIHANVLSLQPGTVQELRVSRFQNVTNGQDLVVVSVIDPDALKAELAAVDADLKVLKTRIDVDKTRNLDAYSHLREDLLTERIAVDLARIRLRQAAGEFERVRELYTNNLTAKGLGLSPKGFGNYNDFGYDVAVRDRDALQAEVDLRTRLVAQLERDLEHLGKVGAVQVTSADPTIEEAIAAQRQRLLQLHKAVVLKAPMNGFVSRINHRPGEKVPAGQPLLVVSSSKSDRIIGWVRQPVRVRPRVGDLVQVRLNRTGQPITDAVVTEVGGQMEPISITALPINTPPNHVEVGLQFMAQVPAGADLIPGEAVEMYLKPRAAR